MPDPKPKGKIDWANLPSSVPAPINWDEVPDSAQHHSVGDLYNYKPGASGLKVEANPYPIENWFGNLENDVKHGTTNTLPGKVLHAMGAPGVETGVEGDPAIGDMFGGEILGPIEVGHASASVPQIHSGKKAVQVINELIKGLGHTLGPAAAVTAPEAIIPSAIYGPAAAGAGKVAHVMGADPDTQELAENLTGIAGPMAHAAMPAVGDFLQNHAAPIGKGLGYTGAAAELIHTKNPMSLLLGSKPAIRAATAATDNVGKVVNWLGQVPKPTDIINSPGSVGTPEGNQFVDNPVESDSADKTARYVGIKLPKAPTPEPRLLGSGNIQLLPPEPTVEPMIRTPASQVVRGQGGRMTKQFLTGEVPEGAKPQMGAQPPVIGNLGESAPPPPFDPANASQDTSAMADNGIKPPEPKLNIDPSKVLPGDFSLNTPSTYFHGSPENLIDTGGIKSNISEGVRSGIDDGEIEGNPENYNGVHVTGFPDTAALFGENVHQVTLPRQSLMRPDPMMPDNGIIHMGDISPSNIDMITRLNPGSSPSEPKPLIQTKPTATEIEPNFDPSKVIPGDRSLTQPQTFYHGSPEDLSSTGITPQIPESIHDLFEIGENEGGFLPKGVTPEDYRGAYLGTEPEDAAMYGRNVHEVNLPAKTMLRVDPMHGALSGPENALIHTGDIPPDQVNLMEGQFRPGGKPNPEFGNLDESGNLIKTSRPTATQGEAVVEPATPQGAQEVKLPTTTPDPQSDSGVLPGDFSLNQPTDYSHFSRSTNLINTGIDPRVAYSEPDLHPDTFKGIYLTNDNEEAAGFGDKHNIRLERGSLMRPDPEFYDRDDPNNHIADPVIYQGGRIPSGNVNTPQDLIDTRGLQEKMRDNLENGQENSDELGRKISYSGSKPDVGKTTGQQYGSAVLPGENDNTDLLPWAQTPWGANNGSVGYLQLPEDGGLIRVPKKGK